MTKRRMGFWDIAPILILFVLSCASRGSAVGFIEESLQCGIDAMEKFIAECDTFHRSAVGFIEESLQCGIDAMEKFIAECDTFHNDSMVDAEEKTTAYLHDIFINGPHSENFNYNLLYAIRNVYATKKLSERAKMPASRLKNVRIIMSEWRKKFGEKYDSTPICTEHDKKWSRINGACNNLHHPKWGMSIQPQLRWLTPAYDDGVGSPRSRGVDGDPLPNPREISNKLFQDTGAIDIDDIDRTILVMHYGQLLDHDLSLTPVIMCPDGTTINCCDTEKDRMECLSIPVPDPDPFFTTQTCINFVRSEPACLPYPDQREQLNKLTSYIDASFVYGSTQAAEQQLREFKHGLLRVTDHNLLPEGPDSLCKEGNGKCVLAGDTRVNVATGLTTLHTLMVRYHNILATKLRQINPRWDDERLYQEVRKIVIAVTQHVTYNEYLPVILGKETMDNYKLSLTEYTGYNKHIDVSIRNAFSTAAFRFGHSQVPSITKYIYPDSETQQPLEDTLMRPTNVNKEDGSCIADIGRWMTRSHSPPAERLFSHSIRNTLFKDDKGKSLDLTALNLQRGRDHGLPSYNEYRYFCRLPKAYHFKSGKDGLVDHSDENALKLEQLYKHVDDIDIFAGGISEKHLPGAAVGPTFACLIAEQFHNLRYGDRFWYENHHNKLFTPEQLYSIKQIRISTILCKTAGLETLQPYVLKPINCEYNYLTLCHDLPYLDLSLFKDPDAQVEYCRPPYGYVREY